MKGNIAVILIVLALATGATIGYLGNRTAGGTTADTLVRTYSRKSYRGRSESFDAGARRRAIGTAVMSFAVIVIIVVGALAVASISQSGMGNPRVGGGSTSTAISSNLVGPQAPQGLRLSVSSNASEIAVGQLVNVSLSIVNTLPIVNSVKSAHDWLIQGVPAALWPPCYFGLPAEAAVVEGNYSLQDIGAAANVTFGYGCAEAVNVDHVIFQPNSDQVNLTGLYDVTGENQTLGPFYTSLSFTTGGYWDLKNLSSEINIPILGEQGPVGPPAYIPFVPGVYTIAVADEWGQVAILHLSVVPGVAANYLANSCTTPVPPPSHSGAADVFVLSPGSIGVICVDYQFRNSGSYSFQPPSFGTWNSTSKFSVYQACGQPNDYVNGTTPPPCGFLNITAVPAYFVHLESENVTVAYFIQTEVGAKGIYMLFIASCDPIVLAVGSVPSTAPTLTLFGCIYSPSFPSGENVAGVSNVNVVEVSAG